MNICLLGASGSIGTQTIDVILKNTKDFTLVAFSIGHQTRKLNKILKLFPHVKNVCLKQKSKIKYYQNKYPEISFYHGDEGLLSLIENSSCDMVVNALVGFVGLVPTIKALELNKKVALANKEALVVGGEIVNKLLKEGKGQLYPIDSEHVAICKCLQVDDKDVKRLILTASGGAFRHLNRQQLNDVDAALALKHPTWKMGAKITIDCATMVNKAFEVIEAHYLFHYPFNKIDIVLHDESLVHSMVEYHNKTYRLEYSKPDMRNPIRYALYETLTPFETELVSHYDDYKKLHFHDFDIRRYPLVSWAEVVINKKGTYGAVFNASNEIAVRYFLENKISFLDIEEIVNHFMSTHQSTSHPTLEEIINVDKLTRIAVVDYINKKGY